MLPNDFKTILENFCQEYSLDYFVQISSSTETSIEISEFAHRTNRHVDEDIVIQLFNAEKQKVVVTLCGIDIEALLQKLHASVNLFTFSEKKFSMPTLAGDKITHEAHTLKSLSELESEVNAHLDTCLTRMREVLDFVEVKKSNFSHESTKRSFYNSAGQEATEIMTPNASYLYAITVKKDGAVDRGYIADLFYNFSQEQRDKMSQQCEELACSVISPQEEVVELEGKTVLLEESAAAQLISALSAHLGAQAVKEKRSVLFDEDEKAKTLSPLFTLSHRTQTGTPYDRVLNGSGERRQEFTVIENGEIKTIFSSLATQQKYDVPSNGVGGFSTLECKGEVDGIKREDFDYVITSIQGMHTIDDRTMDLNMTCLGFVRIEGTLVFSKTLHFSANITQIFGEKLQKASLQTQRFDAICAPKMVIQF